MPGAILLVRTPGHEFIGVIGEADLKWHIPMRTNYAFQIASVTKTFMGAVAAQLHAEGKIDLDLSITNWLRREITQRITNANRITLRQLFEHRSGLPDAYDDFWFLAQRGFLRAYDDWEPMKVLEYTFDRPANFEPEKGWRYCNAGYLLAGLSIDYATGHHHSTEIRKRILTPLNHTNTFYLTVEKPSIEMAHGYENYFNWWRMDTTDWTPATGGSAGLASTVFDLATFIRAVVREDNGRLLSAAARREMFAGWTNENKNYFLGIQRKRPRPDAPWFLGHSGGTPGYHTIVFHQPERDITIVYFGSSILRKIRGGSRLLDEFYDTFRDALFAQTLKETDMPAANARGAAGSSGPAQREVLVQ
jgi:D-alanyl-D-alanine carboxypeptidase